MIIPHFNKYPLITQKKADFILFSSIIELLYENKHSSIEGLNQIINIRSSMNNGLSDELKSAVQLKFLQQDYTQLSLWHINLPI